MDLPKHIIILFGLVFGALADCNLKTTNATINYISCKKLLNYEVYLEQMFRLKTDFEENSNIYEYEDKNNIFIDIEDSHLPTIENWFLMPLKNVLFKVVGIRIYGSNVSKIDDMILDSLSNLKYLSLGNNVIKDFRFLGNSRSLSNIDLRNNSLTHDDVIYIINIMTSLYGEDKVIDLSFNKLDTFDTKKLNFDSRFSSRFNLSLKYCGLSKVYLNSSIFYNNELNLEGNNITDLIRNGNELNIDVLDLSNLSGEFNNGILKSVDYLSKLLLNNNKILELDHTLNLTKYGTFNSHLSVEMSNTSLKNVVSGYFWNSYFSLLKLDRNFLKTISTSTFYKSIIKILDLSNSHISKIDQQSFLFSNISVLNLSSNNISDLTYFCKNSEITELILSNNPIEILKKTYFAACNITALNLSQTYIKDNDPFLFNSLPSLRILEISLSDYYYGNALFGRENSNINTGIISYSNISLDLGNIFNFVPTLERLYLNNSKVLTLSDFGLLGFYSLKTLDSKNLFSNLSFAKLNNRNVTFFKDLVNLESLDLSYLNLRNVNYKFLGGLKRLRTLDLSNNLLSIIPSNTFKDLARLKNLYLNDNKIWLLSVDIFQNTREVRFVNLSSNWLTSLPAGIFSNLLNLTEIDLSNNRFTNITTEIFTPLPVLSHLYLHNNRLTFQKPWERRNQFNYTHLHSNYISLDGNPWGDCIKLGHMLEHFDKNGTRYTPINPDYSKFNIKGINCDG